MPSNKSKLRLFLESVLRILIFTFIATLLGFAIGLFCGIGAGILYGFFRHVRPDMSMAYRFVAAPFAAIALVITFLFMLISEIRRVRRPLALPGASQFRRTS
jgi:uncharacterized BrkB/YihY/UPF0761 family membrane protein